jgi:hypothetical protein
MRTNPSTILAVAVAVAALALSACAAEVAPDPVTPADSASSVDVPAQLAEGERLWRASCPLPGPPELCLESVGAPADPHCGSTTAQLVLRPREAAGRAAAHAAFEAVLAAGRSEPAGSPGRAAAAHALYLLGDEAAEDFFAQEFPAGLDFAEAHKDASTARFKGFIHDTSAALQRAKELYLQAVELGPVDAVPAALRVAQLYERYAHLVALGAVPADVAPEADALAAYCGALTEEAAKLVDKADEARAYCRETWQALPAAARPASDPCATQLEPRVVQATDHADDHH